MGHRRYVGLSVIATELGTSWIGDMKRLAEYKEAANQCSLSFLARGENHHQWR
jgi:hypothetical protein